MDLSFSCMKGILINCSKDGNDNTAKFAACFTSNKLFCFASCIIDCLFTKDKKKAGQGFSAVQLPFGMPIKLLHKADNNADSSPESCVNLTA